MLFKAGQSGNPKGRPKGKETHLTLIRKAINSHVPEIITVMAERAKAGDPAAAKLLLERVIPSLKNVDLPMIIEGWSGTIEERSISLLQALEKGILDPSTVMTLIGTLRAHSELCLLQALEDRISALERKHEYSELENPDNEIGATPTGNAIIADGSMQ